MLKWREIMAHEVINEDGTSKIELAVRLEGADSENPGVFQECVLSRDTLKTVKGLAFLARETGQLLPEIDADDLYDGEINLVVAQIFIDAGFDKLEDFPRWPVPEDRKATGPSI